MFWIYMNQYAGMLALSNLMVYLYHNIPTQRYMQYILRAMVLLDVVAFVPYYIAKSLTNITPCTESHIILIADVIWNIKDVCRIAYITHESLMFVDSHTPAITTHASLRRRVVTIATSIVSFILYLSYICVSYSLDCNTNENATRTVLVVLYSAWSLICLVCAVHVIAKITTIYTALTATPTDSARAYVYHLMRLGSTLAVASLLMLIVAILELARIARPYDVRISSVLIEYSQLAVILYGHTPHISTYMTYIDQHKKAQP